MAHARSVSCRRAVLGWVSAVVLGGSGARGEPVPTSAHSEPLPAFARGRGDLDLSGDGRLGLFASRQELIVWELATGKRKHRVKLRPSAWEIHPSPNGEVTLLASAERLVLVQLLTGRVVEDMSAPSPWPAAREIAWAPEGGEVMLLGFELPGLEPGAGTPIAYFEATLGYVARQIRIPDLHTARGMAVLSGGDGVVVGLPKQLLYLGRSPFDVRSHAHGGAPDFRVITSLLDGVLVIRAGRFEVLDPKTGAVIRTAAIAPNADETFAARPVGSWLVGTNGDGVRIIDLAHDAASLLDPRAFGRPRAIVPLSDDVVVFGRDVRFLARSPQK